MDRPSTPRVLGLFFSTTAVLGLTGCFGAETQSPPDPLTVAVQPGADTDPVAAQGARPARVRSVIDGDTIEVDIDGVVEIVRLLGIDTPETVHPSRPVECFGPESAARLRELTPEGSVVGLVRDQEARDRFGRLLAYVYRDGDGLLVNRSLVRSGHADVLAIAPNNTFAGSLAAARTQARSEDRGLWGACHDAG